MIKSNFYHREYSKNQPIFLENVISIDVFNNCGCVAIIDKYTIAPNERVTLMSSDYTISDVNLNLSFVPIPEDDTANRQQLVDMQFISDVPDIIPARIAPEVRQTVVLYIKQLAN